MILDETLKALGPTAKKQRGKTEKSKQAKSTPGQLLTVCTKVVVDKPKALTQSESGFQLPQQGGGQ